MPLIDFPASADDLKAVSSSSISVVSNKIENEASIIVDPREINDDVIYDDF